jgi:hypothetical protein
MRQGIDGLAPAGTITALGDPATAPRVGVVFNWAPDQIHHRPTGQRDRHVEAGPGWPIFRVEATRRPTPVSRSTPVDRLRPCRRLPIPASPAIQPAGNARLYVANRGDGR